jgi:hypothetical protein
VQQLTLKFGFAYCVLFKLNWGHTIPNLVQLWVIVILNTVPFWPTFWSQVTQPLKRRLGQFVTGHNGGWRDGQKYSVPGVHYLLLTIDSPKICLKRCLGCHTSSQALKRCSSLCGSHRSQGVKSRLKSKSSELHSLVSLLTTFRTLLPYLVSQFWSPFL